MTQINYIYIMYILLKLSNQGYLIKITPQLMAVNNEFKKFDVIMDGQYYVD